MIVKKEAVKEHLSSSALVLCCVSEDSVIFLGHTSFYFFHFHAFVRMSGSSWAII